MTIAAVFPIVREFELVSRGHLQSRAAGRLPLLEVVVRCTAPVRRVNEWIAAVQVADDLPVHELKRRSRRRGIVGAHDGTVAAPRALRSVEPQLIPDERSAKRSVHVPHFFDPGQRFPGETARHEIVGQICRALHAGSGVISDEGAAEGVGTRLGNEVHVHAMGRRFRSAITELDRYFLRRSRVRREYPAAPVIRLETVDECLVVTAARAVNLQLHVRLALAAADVLGRRADRSHREARRQRGERLERLVCRHRIECIA